jgi:flagellar protein FlgJ
MDPLTLPARDVVSKAVAGAGTPPDRTGARIRESAREFESVFLSLLLRTMRRTVPDGGNPALGGGNRVYQEMMDEELARTMAKGRGVGLADILVRDLTRNLTRKNPSSLPSELPMANRH